MNPLESWLSKLESRIQSLVEGTAARLLPAGDVLQPEPPVDELPESTAPLSIDAVIDTPVQLIPGAAFLVVDGVRLFPLEQAVVSIGRAPENDLVINDPRVSRQHAQLRAVAGQFVIFDLDSTGGTSLNGQPVSQRPLTPGDVILLAGVPLVYGQENPSGAGMTQELSL